MSQELATGMVGYRRPLCGALSTTTTIHRHIPSHPSHLPCTSTAPKLYLIRICFSCIVESLACTILQEDLEAHKREGVVCSNSSEERLPSRHRDPSARVCIHYRSFRILGSARYDLCGRSRVGIQCLMHTFLIEALCPPLPALGEEKRSKSFGMYAEPRAVDGLTM